MSLPTPETSPKCPVCTREEQCCELASALHWAIQIYSKNLRSSLGLWFVVLMLPNCWPVRTASSSEKIRWTAIGTETYNPEICVAKGFPWAMPWDVWLRDSWGHEVWWGEDSLSGGGQVTLPTARGGRGSDAKMSWFCSTIAQDPQPLWALFVTLDTPHLQTKWLPHHLWQQEQKIWTPPPPKV